MRITTLKGRVIVRGHCKARALVSKKPISFLGGIDPANGKIIERDHDLLGQCIRDKALCFPHGHGSTVGSYVLYSLARNNLGPKAIINVTADPVVVVGAIIADIPMIDQVDILRIKNNEYVEVNAVKGFVKILTKENAEEPCI